MTIHCIDFKCSSARLLDSARFELIYMWSLRFGGQHLRLMLIESFEIIVWQKAFDSWIKFNVMENNWFSHLLTVCCWNLVLNLIYCYSNSAFNGNSNWDSCKIMQLCFNRIADVWKIHYPFPNRQLFNIFQGSVKCSRSISRFILTSLYFQ